MRFAVLSLRYTRVSALPPSNSFLDRLFATGPYRPQGAAGTLEFHFESGYIASITTQALLYSIVDTDLHHHCRLAILASNRVQEADIPTCRNSERRAKRGLSMNSLFLSEPNRIDVGYQNLRQIANDSNILASFMIHQSYRQSHQARRAYEPHRLFKAPQVARASQSLQ
jgi:hypothetical protein